MSYYFIVINLYLISMLVEIIQIRKVINKYIVFNIKLLILLHINHLISGLPCYTKRF